MTAAEERDSHRARLWVSYTDTRVPVIRDQIAIAYVPLVRYVASRVGRNLPPTVELDELVSFGFFGLIEAIERFDVLVGTKFETYAIPRIRGAILDELRKLDWFPRSVRALARKLDAARSELEHSLQRAPEPLELAIAMELTLDELEDALARVEGASVMSLSTDSTTEEMSISERLVDPTHESSHDVATRRDFIRELARRICSLPERERILLTLLYFESLQPAEVGELLGISPTRVGQMRNAAVLKLKG